MWVSFFSFFESVVCIFARQALKKPISKPVGVPGGGSGSTGIIPVRGDVDFVGRHNHHERIV